MIRKLRPQYGYIKTFVCTLTALLSFCSFAMCHEGDHGSCAIQKVHNITQGNHYCTINDAINHAASGDVIEIEPGVYNEPIHFNGTDITLTSIAPHDRHIVENTIIDLSGAITPATVIAFAGSESENCLLTGFTITGGNSADAGGGINGNGCNATISYCIITDNSAFGNGGGIANISGAITHCKILNNTTSASGAISGCDGIIVNNIIANNKSIYDPSAFAIASAFENCYATIVNNIVFGNDIDNAPSVGEQHRLTIFNYDGSTESALVANNIIVQNNKTFATDIFMHFIPGATRIIEYNCIENWAPDQFNNINTDPLFVDPDGQDNTLGTSDDDLGLRPDSPCIDAGNNDDIPFYIITDLNGAIRIFNCDVDMGAQETQMAFAKYNGDTNCDNKIDYEDITVLNDAWQTSHAEENYTTITDFNSDGTIDTADLYMTAENWLIAPIILAPAVVINNDVTNIGETHATLSGMIIDNGGLNPNVEIRYGTTDGSGEGLWDHWIPLGAQGKSFSVNIHGLTPNTRYYFRAYARSSNDIISWADTTATFKTQSDEHVSLLSDWTTGLTHIAEPGNNRALIFTAHAQDDDKKGSYLTTVTYGTRQMTMIAQDEYKTAPPYPYQYYVSTWILTESDIVLASNDGFEVQWNHGGPDNAPGYSSIFLENVDPNDPVGAIATNNCECETLATTALPTEPGDLVLLTATHGGPTESADFQTRNHFIEMIEFGTPPDSAEVLCGYKYGRGYLETPAVHTPALGADARKALIGFVVQKEH